MHIEVDDLTRRDVHALLAEHLADMHATSPPDSVHALDRSGLSDPTVTVWTLWDGPQVLGCAALKELSALEGEVKSMRTTALARGRGVASSLLTHVMDEARRRGYQRLSLETGTQPFFAPARRLYERHGFITCAPFGDYTADPNSTFFTRTLSATQPAPLGLVDAVDAVDAVDPSAAR
jgi:putative acetyltransferase